MNGWRGWPHRRLDLPSLTVRGISQIFRQIIRIHTLSGEAHRALKVRAAQINRSAEAEMRAILETAVRPEGRLRLGAALSKASREMGLTNADVEALEQAIDARRNGD